MPLEAVLAWHIQDRQLPRAEHAVGECFASIVLPIAVCLRFRHAVLGPKLDWAVLTGTAKKMLAQEKVGKLILGRCPAQNRS